MNCRKWCATCGKDIDIEEWQDHLDEHWGNKLSKEMRGIDH